MDKRIVNVSAAKVHSFGAQDFPIRIFFVMKIYIRIPVQNNLGGGGGLGWSLDFADSANINFLYTKNSLCN